MIAFSGAASPQPRAEWAVFPGPPLRCYRRLNVDCRRNSPPYKSAVRTFGATAHLCAAASENVQVAINVQSRFEELCTKSQRRFAQSMSAYGRAMLITRNAYSQRRRRVMFIALMLKGSSKLRQERHILHIAPDGA
jgi:hypothetical protein